MLDRSPRCHRRQRGRSGLPKGQPARYAHCLLNPRVVFRLCSRVYVDSRRKVVLRCRWVVTLLVGHNVPTRWGWCEENKFWSFLHRWILERSIPRPSDRKPPSLRRDLSWSQMSTESTLDAYTIRHRMDSGSGSNPQGEVTLLSTQLTDGGDVLLYKGIFPLYPSPNHALPTSELEAGFQPISEPRCTRIKAPCAQMRLGSTKSRGARGEHCPVSSDRSKR